MQDGKRAQFVTEYLKDFNATNAAMRAGYSAKAARTTGYRLLRNAEVAASLAERSRRALEKAAVNEGLVLGELLKIGTSDVRKVFDAEGNLIPIHKLDDATAMAVAGVDVVERQVKIKKVKDPDEGEDQLTSEVEFTKKIKFWDKPRALELLGKHLKLFHDIAPPAPPLVVIINSPILPQYGNDKP